MNNLLLIALFFTFFELDITTIPKNNFGNPLANQTIDRVQDLPVNITKSKKDSGDEFALILSGDGGWNSFSQQLADAYAANGISVIGLNSLKYFWKKKSPQDSANEIAALLNKYANDWQKKKIILCGYSFGAEVLPFIYRRLPSNLKDKITLIQLLSPASYTDFEIHVTDLLGSENPVRSMSISTEIEKLDVPILCYYGALEKEKPLKNLKKVNFRIIILPGDHHYKNNVMMIVNSLKNRNEP